MTQRSALEDLDQNKLDLRAALIKVEQLERELSETQRDNTRLRDMVEGNLQDVMIKEMHFEDGLLEMWLQHPIFWLFSLGISQMFIAQGAKNYLETRIWVPEVGFINVTCQKEDMKSPHTLRLEAEAETERIRAELAIETEKYARDLCQLREAAGELPDEARRGFIQAVCEKVRWMQAQIAKYDELLWLLKHTGFEVSHEADGRPYLHKRGICAYYASLDEWEARKAAE
jgi:hypothetical protein